MADNVLTRPIGPLPTWGWVGIIGGGVITWAIVAHRSSSSPSPGTSQLQPPFVLQTTPPEQTINVIDDDDDDKKKPPRHHKKKKKRHKRPIHYPGPVPHPTPGGQGSRPLGPQR